MEKILSVLKYPGAKNRIAPWILKFIPEHNVYLEPFAGSLAVLFAKKPSNIETVNDLDGEVVNFFRVLREYPETLSKMIYFSPYARDTYEEAYHPASTPLDRAYKFCIRCWMGFGCANRYHNGFRSGQQSTSPNPARAWANLPETLIIAADRLKNVQIENLPATELIRRYNTSDVFIYADPPYPQSIRKSYLYREEMDERQHRELLDLLKKHPGKVLLSSYENELYEKELKGWNRAEKSTSSEHGQRTEVLYYNYDLPYEQLNFLWNV